MPPLRIFLDIETVPPARRRRAQLSLESIIKILRPGKSRESILSLAVSAAGKNSGQSCPEEIFRQLALHAEYGRILCIGVIVEKGGSETRRGVFGFDAQSKRFHLDEAKTLRGFWQLLKREKFDARRDFVIGHNILDFDLPFIYKRSHILRVTPTIELCFARYRRQPIFDTMREWSLWNMREAPLSLGHLARLLDVGIGKIEDLDGSRVYDEYLAGGHQRISDYCLRDAEVARAVYKRLSAVDRT